MSSGPGIPDAANLGDRPFVMSRVATAFLVLTWTAVILRVYVRTVLIRSFGWDDWTIIITLVGMRGGDVSTRRELTAARFSTPACARAS